MEKRVSRLIRFFLVIAFGGDCFVHAQLPSRGFAQLIDLQDRTVIGGAAQNLGTNDLMTLRYTIPGALDTTYNPDGAQPGVVLTSIDDDDDVIVGLALDFLEGIVFVGTSTNGIDLSMVVGRYTSTGQLDTTFNATGTTPGLVEITEDLGISVRAAGVVIDSAGSIIAAGTETVDVAVDSSIFIAKFNSDGTFDTDFGNGIGFIEFSFFGTEEVQAVTVDNQDRILVVGATTPEFGANQQVLIARFNEDGSVDETFGASLGVPGAVLLDLGSDSTGFDIKIDSEDRIVVGGSTGDGIDSSFFVARLLDDGELDETFNSAGSTPGVVITGFDNTEAVARSLAIDRSGRVIATGFLSEEFTQTQFMTVRYTEDGELDEEFAAGTTTPGIVLTSITPTLDTTQQPLAKAFAVDVIESILPNRPSYRIVTTGFSFNGQQENVTTIAYTEDGELDETFNANGDIPGILVTEITAGQAITQNEFAGGSMWSYLDDAYGWPVDERLLRQLSPTFLYPATPWIEFPRQNEILEEGLHTVVGYTHPHSTVTLFANGKFAGAAVSDDLGQWRIRTNLAAGVSILSVTVFDYIAKLHYTSDPVIVRVNAVRRGAFLNYPHSGAELLPEEVAFQGTGMPDSHVALALNGQYLTDLIVSQSGAWEFMPELLAPGEYLLELYDVNQPESKPSAIEFFVIESDEEEPEEEIAESAELQEEREEEPVEKLPEEITQEKLPSTEIIVQGKSAEEQVRVFLNRELSGFERPDITGVWRHPLHFVPTRTGQHRVDVSFDAQPTTVAMQRFSV